MSEKGPRLVLPQHPVPEPMAPDYYGCPNCGCNTTKRICGYCGAFTGAPSSVHELKSRRAKRP